MSKYPQTSDACVDKWVQSVIDVGNLEKTVRGYREHINIILRLLADNERETLPYKWTQDDMRFLKSKWDEKDLKVGTQLYYHYVFCTVADFFGNKAPSTFKINWPPKEVERRWLEIDQMIRVMSTPMTPIQELGIELMARMGRRRIENLRALVKDMRCDATDPYMLVDGKGHKRHRMPFALTTDKILGRWLDMRSSLLKETLNDHVDKIEQYPYLFMWFRGRKLGNYEQNKGTGYDKAVTTAVSLASGIHFSNHDLRRTFGRELYFTAGVDPVIIQGYYNHASLDQTLWYIGADQRRMAEAIKKMPY